jgi:hypothetical protein
MILKAITIQKLISLQDKIGGNFKLQTQLIWLLQEINILIAL